MGVNLKLNVYSKRPFSYKKLQMLVYVRLSHACDDMYMLETDIIL